MVQWVAVMVPPKPIQRAAKPPSYMIDARKAGALALMLAVSALIVYLFLSMVGPAAAREVQAACTGMRPSWSGKAFKQIPAQAPDFALQDVDGQTVRLSDFKGKVVVVNFWASWCDVCKAEKKSLASFTRSMAGDVVVLTIASDEDAAEIDRSLRLAMGSHEGPAAAAWGGVPFRVLVDPPGDKTLGPVSTAWGIEKVPESYVIDKNGTIRMYLVNKRDWSAGVVETCVRSLVDE